MHDADRQHLIVYDPSLAHNEMLAALPCGERIEIGAAELNGLPEGSKVHVSGAVYDRIAKMPDVAIVTH